LELLWKNAGSLLKKGTADSTKATKKTDDETDDRLSGFLSLPGRKTGISEDFHTGRAVALVSIPLYEQDR
jgi:hypothetical protein